MAGQSPNQLLPDPLPFEEIRKFPFPPEWNDALIATNCQHLRIAAQIALNATPPEGNGVTLEEIASQLTTAQGPNPPYTFAGGQSNNPLVPFLDAGALPLGLVSEDSQRRYHATDKGRAAAPVLGVLAAHIIEYNVDLPREIGNIGRQRAIITPATSLALIQEIAHSGPIDPAKLSTTVNIPNAILHKKINYLCTQGILRKTGSSGPGSRTVILPDRVVVSDRPYRHSSSEAIVLTAKRLVEEEGLRTINSRELIEEALKLIPDDKPTVEEAWRLLAQYPPAGLKFTPLENTTGYYINIEGEGSTPYINLIRMIHSLRDPLYRKAAEEVAESLAPRKEEGVVQPSDLLRRLLLTRPTNRKPTQPHSKKPDDSSASNAKEQRPRASNKLPPSIAWLRAVCLEDGLSAWEAERKATQVEQLTSQGLAIVSSVNDPPQNYPKHVLEQLKARGHAAENGNFVFFSGIALSTFNGGERRALALFHDVDTIFYGNTVNIDKLRMALNLPPTAEGADPRAQILWLAENRFMPRFWRAKAASREHRQKIEAMEVVDAQDAESPDTETVAEES
jgi:hypothetical protein